MEELIERLKFGIEYCCVNGGQSCVIRTKDLQELLLNYANSLNKIKDLERKLDVYRSYKDCDEEFEL